MFEMSEFYCFIKYMKVVSINIGTAVFCFVVESTSKFEILNYFKL
jgi:hypothetical protein